MNWLLLLNTKTLDSSEFLVKINIVSILPSCYSIWLDPYSVNAQYGAQYRNAISMMML